MKKTRARSATATTAKMTFSSVCLTCALATSSSSRFVSNSSLLDTFVASNFFARSKSDWASICVALACSPCGDARPDLRNLVVHIFNRVLEFETQTASLPDLTTYVRLRHDQFRLSGIDGSLLNRDSYAIRFRVELNEHVAFLDPIIVSMRTRATCPLTRGATNVT